MPSFLQEFLPAGRVFPIRIRKERPRETGGSTSHPSPPTTDSPDESRLLSEAVEVIQLVSPMVQAVAGVIPVAGTPLKAAVDGLLYIIQMIDTTKRNKAALDDLASRLRRLLEFLSHEPLPRDDVEARRRTALAQCLQDTSRKLMKMQGRRGLTLAYKSMTQDIADCNTDIDRFLSEYALYDLAFIKRQLRQMLASPRDCTILIDAAGHEHKVPLEYCTSFQQLKDMLSVLIPPERSGASVQRRYISSEKFDFCIDDGKRVALLTRDSNVWQNIEAGTRIVMRVVFERQALFYAPYHECHLCGAWSKLGAFSNSPGWLTDDSLDCHACKGRFQISYDRDRKTQGLNDGIDTETRHCIRNFRLMLTEPDADAPLVSNMFMEDEDGEPVEMEPIVMPLTFTLGHFKGDFDHMATTTCHDPNDGFAVSHEFQRSPLYGMPLEPGAAAQQFATSSRPLSVELCDSEDDHFEECEDELQEVESV